MALLGMQDVTLAFGGPPVLLAQGQTKLQSLFLDAHGILACDG